MERELTKKAISDHNYNLKLSHQKNAKQNYGKA